MFVDLVLCGLGLTLRCNTQEPCLMPSLRVWSLELGFQGLGASAEPYTPTLARQVLSQVMANWCAHKGYPRLKEEEEVADFDSGCWGCDPFLGILLEGFSRGIQASWTEYCGDSGRDPKP